MTGRTPSSIVSKCRELRQIDRLSLREISSRTGVALGTLSGLLKGIVLTDEEIASRKTMAAAAGRAKNSQLALARRGDESPFFDIIKRRGLSTDQKGAVAEAAAIFRMKVWGLIPHVPLCAGGTSDIGVFVPDTGRLLRVQVKCARRGVHGMPIVPLRARHGGRAGVRYESGSFDILVGYDMREDVCYVYTEAEVASRASTKSMTKDAAERWEKLLDAT